MISRGLVRCLVCILFSAFFWACNGNLERTLDMAEDNRQELEKVLCHYRDNSQKLSAAKFLLENMQHYCVQNGEPVFDARHIYSEFLIRNTDAAFESWKNAVWKDEIDFESFCRYILPYRVNDEPLSAWRDTLRNEYGHLIVGIDDPIKAFAKVYSTVVKKFNKTSNVENGSLDVLSLHRVLKGSCEQRSIYIVAVLRSLGIPAAYDYVPFWGNYSTTGHAWVSYVNDGRTFTVFGNDTIAKEFNRIDGENFSDNGLLEHPRQQWDSIKRVPVVLRKCYDRQLPLSSKSNSGIPMELDDPFSLNVSRQYGFTHSATTKNSFGKQPYLCAFRTGSGWQAVTDGDARMCQATFNDLPGQVVYLPANHVDGRIVPVGAPFLLKSDGSICKFAPDKENLKSVTLWRKYPLRKQWYGRWEKVLGSTVEVSNDSLFENQQVVHTFERVPETIVRIALDMDRPYRYIRFHAHKRQRPEMAEFKVFSTHDKQLDGTIIYHKRRAFAETAGHMFDNDYLTYTSRNSNGYWVGLDLGENSTDTIGCLEICVRHDMNMIRQGNQYELFYYDYGWKSLGTQVAQADSLVFDNVPTGALLWLKNHSGGREERIFTYENGKQVWW